MPTNSQRGGSPIYWHAWRVVQAKTWRTTTTTGRASVIRVASSGESVRGGVAAGEGAVLACPRGVSSAPATKDGNEYDEWNIHARPESPFLIESLITSLLKPLPPATELEGSLKVAAAKYQSGIWTGNFVNANKVILWGFSAGGRRAPSSSPPRSRIASPPSLPRPVIRTPPRATLPMPRMSNCSCSAARTIITAVTSRSSGHMCT